MHKNSRGKRGFALVNVLVMMILVMMLCMLVMAIAVYNTNMAKKATLAFENKLELDIIGNDFLREKAQLLDLYLTKEKLGEDGLPVQDEFGGTERLYEYSSIGGGAYSTTQIESSRRVITLTNRGDLYTLVVSSKGGEVLLSITQNVRTSHIISWSYGAVAAGYIG